MIEREVLTLAVGKPVYVDLAITLARSFLHWHSRSDIRFVIATDQPERIAPDVAGRVEVRSVRPGQYGDGFSPKLHLDRLARARQTLFVDADSLCVAPLTDCFDRFGGHAVATIATPIKAGEWFGDVDALCRHFGVRELPKFNGGVYYLEPGPKATMVYEMARSIEPSYDALGLVRLRGKANEEVLMAIAMAVHGLNGIPEDGTIMAEPLNFACGLRVDVLGGGALLLNTPGHPRHVSSWKLSEARPRIVHFLGHHTDRLPYVAEATRLEKVVARGWPKWAADVFALGTCTIPARARDVGKLVLRPAYHKLFGYRPIAPSARG